MDVNCTTGDSHAALSSVQSSLLMQNYFKVFTCNSSENKLFFFAARTARTMAYWAPRPCLGTTGHKLKWLPSAINFIFECSLLFDCSRIWWPCSCLDRQHIKQKILRRSWINNCARRRVLWNVFRPTRIWLYGVGLPWRNPELQSTMLRQ